MLIKSNNLHIASSCKILYFSSPDEFIPSAMIHFTFIYPFSFYYRITRIYNDWPKNVIIDNDKVMMGNLFGP